MSVKNNFGHPSSELEECHKMRIVRLKEVIDLTGLARSTIYKYIGKNIFPKRVSLGDRCVGWLLSDIEDWILAKVEARDLAEGNSAQLALQGGSEG
jgi:prophage regulatory protein